MSAILTLSVFGVVISLILIAISFTELLPPKWSFDIPVVVLIVSCIGLGIVTSLEKREIKNNQREHQMKEYNSKLNEDRTMENKISIQRALTTIKLFEKNYTLNNAFQSAAVASNGKTSASDSVNEFEEAFKDQFKSVTDKLEHIFKLRKAIHKSNMENYVEVPRLGRMAISDVITYRQTTLPHIRSIADKLTNQYNDAVRKYEQAHAAWVKELSEVTSKLDNSTSDTKEYYNVLTKEISKREPKIIFDKELHKKYIELVDFFTEELDIILSEHNASTFIVVE